MGALTPWGSRRVAADTREATWFASLAWSVDWSKAEDDRACPRGAVGVDVRDAAQRGDRVLDHLRHLLVDHARGGPGVGRGDDDEGKLMEGNWSTPRFSTEIRPKAKIATNTPMAKT